MMPIDDDDLYDEDERKLTEQLRRELSGLDRREQREFLRTQPCCLLTAEGRTVCGKDEASVTVSTERVTCRDCRSLLGLGVEPAN